MAATQTQDTYTSGVCPNTSGPTIGQFCIPEGKTAWNVCDAGTSARFRSLPRYDESPAAPAKIVSARPETIWLARSVITRNAWIAAMQAALNAATNTATMSETTGPA